MTQPTVTGDILKTRNALGHLTPQLPLDDVILVKERREASQLVFMEITS
jgi:hypothetical protein